MKPPVWHLFWISAPPGLRDVISGFLPGIGSNGVMEQGGRLGAYFPPGNRSREEVWNVLQGMLEGLAAAGLRTETVRIEYEPVEDQDWNETWKRTIQPIVLGCDVTIVPPWLEPDASYPGVTLVIDPGTAFGTGHHETTADCLCALREYAREALEVSQGFADLGTGTGILAILAARVGFKAVLGIDNDPDAISAALHNIRLNRLENSIRMRLGTVDLLPPGCGMITANLFAGLLADYMAGMVGALSQGGILVLSGMLEGQDTRIERAMKASGLHLRERLSRERWVTLIGMRG